MSIFREASTASGTSMPRGLLVRSFFMGGQGRRIAHTYPYQYSIVQGGHCEADARVERDIYDRERFDNENNVVYEERYGFCKKERERWKYEIAQGNHEPEYGKKGNDGKNADVRQKRGQREVAEIHDGERGDAELCGER